MGNQYSGQRHSECTRSFQELQDICGVMLVRPRRLTVVKTVTLNLATVLWQLVRDVVVK